MEIVDDVDWVEYGKVDLSKVTCEDIVMRPEVGSIHLYPL